MQPLEVSGAVSFIDKSLGVKGLNSIHDARTHVYKTRKTVRHINVANQSSCIWQV